MPLSSVYCGYCRPPPYQIGECGITKSFLHTHTHRNNGIQAEWLCQLEGPKGIHTMCTEYHLGYSSSDCSTVPPHTKCILWRPLKMVLIHALVTREGSLTSSKSSKYKSRFLTNFFSWVAGGLGMGGSLGVPMQILSTTGSLTIPPPRNFFSTRRRMEGMFSLYHQISDCETSLQFRLTLALSTVSLVNSPSSPFPCSRTWEGRGRSGDKARLTFCWLQASAVLSAWCLKTELENSYSGLGGKLPIIKSTESFMNKESPKSINLPN